MFKAFQIYSSDIQSLDLSVNGNFIIFMEKQFCKGYSKQILLFLKNESEVGDVKVGVKQTFVKQLYTKCYQSFTITSTLLMARR